MSPKEIMEIKNLSVEQLHDKLQELRGSEIGDKIRMTILTGNRDYLNITAEEAVEYWINKTSVKHVPVIDVEFVFDKEGRKISHRWIVKESNTPDDGIDVDDPNYVGIVYKRTWIPSVVIASVKQERYMRYNAETEEYEEKILLAPRKITFNGRSLTKIAGMDKVAFYTDNPIPQLNLWIDSILPQKKNDLGTGLKREGKLLDFSHVDLSKMISHKEDYGVIVLEDSDYYKVIAQLGVIINTPFQGTLLGDGWYFKGQITSVSLCNMESGVYGGVKRANDDVELGKVIYGSIFKAFTLEPWSTSFSRQMADYAGIEFNPQLSFPTPSTTFKALTGFRGSIISYNSEILGNLKKAFNKFELINSYAGKISAYNTDKDVHFVIMSDQFKEEEIVEMAFNRWPNLPIQSWISRVRVLLLPNNNIVNHLICLNTNEINRHWIEKWYGPYHGGDLDGDGGLLSRDPRLLTYAEFNENHIDDWYDTTAIKSTQMKPASTVSDAVDIAEYRIKENSSLIGKMDKSARRVKYEFPSKLTREFRIAFTDAEGLSISSKKKNVDPILTIGANKYHFKYMKWLKEFLIPEEISMLYPQNGIVFNVHDILDEFADQIREYLRLESELRIATKKGKFTVVKLSKEKDAAFNKINISLRRMPENYRNVASRYIEMLQGDDDNTVDNLRDYAHELSINCNVDYTEEDKAGKIIFDLKTMWRSIVNNKNEDSDDNNGLTFAFIGRYMRVLIDTYKGNKKYLLARIIAEMPDYLVSMLDIDDILKIGYNVTVYLPIFNDVKIGDSLTKQELMARIPMFRDIPGNRFEFIGTKNISGVNFFTNKGNSKTVERVAIVKICK